VLRRYQPVNDLFPSEHLIKTVGAGIDQYAAELALPGDKSPWIGYVRQLRAEGKHG
jgi:acyl-CoA dehydrogenase